MPPRTSCRRACFYAPPPRPLPKSSSLAPVRVTSGGNPKRNSRTTPTISSSSPIELTTALHIMAFILSLVVSATSGIRTSSAPSSPLFPDRSLTGALVRPRPARARGSPPRTLERRKVCRIFGRGICRALAAEQIRHCRANSEEVLTRRCLSLDYVLEHPGLPWPAARVRADRGVRSGTCIQKWRRRGCGPLPPTLLGS